MCGFAVSINQLILFRVFQGLGAAMVMAITPAIIAHTFPPSERGRTLGMIPIAVAVGASSGPVLGGFLIEFYSWRSIFFINCPVGAVLLILIIKILPKGKTKKMGIKG